MVVHVVFQRIENLSSATANSIQDSRIHPCVADVDMLAATTIREIDSLISRVKHPLQAGTSVDSRTLQLHTIVGDRRVRRRNKAPLLRYQNSFVLLRLGNTLELKPKSPASLCRSTDTGIILGRITFPLKARITHILALFGTYHSADRLLTTAHVTNMNLSLVYAIELLQDFRREAIPVGLVTRPVILLHELFCQRLVASGNSTFRNARPNVSHCVEVTTVRLHLTHDERLEVAATFHVNKTSDNTDLTSRTAFILLAGDNSVTNVKTIAIGHLHTSLCPYYSRI